MTGLRLSFALVVAPALLACSPQPVAAQSAKAGSTAIPANYRQLVARHIAPNLKNWGKLRKALISRPGEGWMGIIQGNRPIACATIRAQGQFIEQTYTVGFTFRGGRIDDVFYPGGYNPMIGAVGAALQEALTCGKLTYGPFPELGGAR
jgi:hypothetical protein